MMTRVFWMAALAVMVSLAASMPAAACWAAPQPQVWGLSTDGQHEYLRDNDKSTIAIYTKGQRDKALWTAEIVQFDSLFSRIFVAKGGDSIVHVRGNHQVSTLEDVAVSIYSRDGSVKHLAAKTFVKQIAKPALGQMRVSTDPGRYWLRDVAVTNEQLAITTWDKAQHTIAI